MKLDKKITLTLDENEVKEIISLHLRCKGYDVRDIELSVGTEWVGYGMDEHQVSRFKGCIASLSEV